jgi:hypothetical protein
MERTEMNEEGWKIILLEGLCYAGIAGVFAWTGYITMGLSVFGVGLLVLIIVASRGGNAQPLKVWQDRPQPR